MRDYGVVSPQIWIGKTGKALRGNMPAQLVALYLMTSPHANMIGVYYCPKDSIAREIGIPYEGACEALARLIEGEFCLFDEESEEVFVKRMAAFQIGEQLDAKDNRCKGVARELEKVTSEQLRIAFHAIYSVAFHIPDLPGSKAKKARPSKAPSKPGTGSEAGTEENIHPGFARFWSAWPKSDRKESRGKCLEVWVKAKAEPHTERIVAHIERLKASAGWKKNGGEFIPAPLVYLNQRKWEGTEEDAAQQWWTGAGFADRFEAENAGCRQGNASQFHNGKRDEVPA